MKQLDVQFLVYNLLILLKQDSVENIQNWYICIFILLIIAIFHCQTRAKFMEDGICIKESNA